MPLRYNGIIFEFNRRLKTKSHPELAENWALEIEEAQEIIDFARASGLQIGVEFNSPGHQNETRMMEVYPELIERQAAFCVSSPKAFKIVSDLINEYIDFFAPDFINFGVDEVQYDGNECNFGHCLSCRNKRPPALFADYLRRLNSLLPLDQRRGIWGDMLLQHRQFGDAVWGNGTPGEVWQAIDFIPWEVEIFDWHYHPPLRYESIDYFKEHEFIVWAVTAFDFEGIRRFCSYAEDKESQQVLHTAWAVPNQEIMPIESMVWAVFYHWFGKEADKLPVREIALDFCRKFWD